MAKKKSKGHGRGNGTHLTEAEMIEARNVVELYGSRTAGAKTLGISRQTLNYRYNKALGMGIGATVLAPPKVSKEVERNSDGTVKEKKKVKEDGNSLSIEYLGVQISTPEKLIEDCDVDMTEWEVDRVVLNNWEVSGKIHQGQEIHEGKNNKLTPTWEAQKLWKTPLRSIKVYLKRKTGGLRAFEAVLRDMQANSPVVKKTKRPKKLFKSHRRSLELCLMDPHLGMECFPGTADHAWSLNDCEDIAMWAIESLLKAAEAYAPIEEIIFPFGNDYMNHDNLENTTTRGTGQPESMQYHHVYKRGIDLAIRMCLRMAEVAPVKVYQIPGNHDYQTSYTMGHVLWGRFFENDNITVDAGASPYKFHKYGTNLIGYEHGSSINAVRLAALMANECSGTGTERDGWWNDTTYREWHLGDQHRKGSSKPHTFEEQGVSIEYLPGLTPPNAWHRQKSFNWQKRGAMGFVWDYDKGPVARLQVNLNSYTGMPTGTKLSNVSDIKKLFTK